MSRVGFTHPTAFPKKRKIKSKIRIRKRIKRKSKIKSKTLRGGLSPTPNLNPALNPLPNPNLALNLSLLFDWHSRLYLPILQQKSGPRLCETFAQPPPQLDPPRDVGKFKPACSPQLSEKRLSIALLSLLLSPVDIVAARAASESAAVFRAGCELT